MVMKGPVKECMDIIGRLKLKFVEINWIILGW
jgi:hypothetical protein